MWSLDSFEPVHRAKLTAGVLSLTVVNQHQFFIYTEMEVKLFRLVHMHDTFAQYNSAVVAIAQADSTTVLVQSEDGSARLVRNPKRSSSRLADTLGGRKTRE
eukprot:5866848-Pyramimonas_sp.AAC.3